MKSLIIIFLLFILNISAAKATEYSNTASFGNKDSLRDFNQWLYDNGHNQYIRKELFIS